MIFAEFENYETSEVADVSFSVTNCYLDRVGDLSGILGDVTIEMNDGTQKLISGEHGVNDYWDEYGFEIKFQEEC